MIANQKSSHVQKHMVILNNTEKILTMINTTILNNNNIIHHSVNMFKNMGPYLKKYILF